MPAKQTEDPLGDDAPVLAGLRFELFVDDRPCVDDVDAAYKQAAAPAERHGGHVEPLDDQPWELRGFRLVDPDGYYLRVTSHRRQPCGRGVR